MPELNALVERHKNTQEWLNYRAALICAVLANVWREKGKRAYTPQDFMPSVKHKQQTMQQMFEMIKLLNAAYSGTVQEN